MKGKKINVDGIQVRLVSQNETDFISLSDIANKFGEAKEIIRSWVRNTGTLNYLAEWEQFYNPEFKYKEFEQILIDMRNNYFSMSPKKWIDLTNAKGIYHKIGRGGGTFSHSDIAINFCYWLSPKFQIYFINEFQKLKSEEAERLGQKWDVNRYLSRVNYHIHTDSIKQFIVTPRHIPRKVQGGIYASEADVLNVAVFGITAKAWREQNTDKPVGKNIRDYATTAQLHVLANLEAINGMLIELGINQQERLTLLTDQADKQKEIIKNKPYLPKKK